MKSPSILALLFSLLVPAMAVEEAQPRHLRFIPFFDLPVWRETGLPTDGPKVELPPSPVALVSGDSVVPFQLAARSFSELVTIK